MRRWIKIYLISSLALAATYACMNREGYVLEGASYEEVLDEEADIGKIEINYEGLSDKTDVVVGTDENGEAVHQRVTRMSFFLISGGRLILGEDDLNFENLEGYALAEDKNSLGLDASELALAEIVSHFHNSSIEQLTVLSETNSQDEKVERLGFFDIVEDSLEVHSSIDEELQDSQNSDGVRYLTTTMSMKGEGRALDSQNESTRVKIQQYELNFMIGSYRDPAFHRAILEATVRDHVVYVGGPGSTIGSVVRQETEMEVMKDLIENGEATANTLFLADGCGSEAYEELVKGPFGTYDADDNPLEINMMSHRYGSNYGYFAPHIMTLLIAMTEGRDWTAPEDAEDYDAWGILDTYSVNASMSIEDVIDSRDSRYANSGVLRNNKEFDDRKGGYRLVN